MIYNIITLQSRLQLGRQVAWRIVFVANDIIALIDRLKKGKCVANTEDRRQASSQQFPHWWPWVLRYLPSQLINELLLALFNVRLRIHKQHKFTVSSQQLYMYTIMIKLG